MVTDMVKFLEYKDELDLICESSISNFDFNTKTILQIKDCSVLNAVNMFPCDIWSKGTLCASLANEPDKDMISFISENEIKLSNIKNKTPVDIFGETYYVL